VARWLLAEEAAASPWKLYRTMAKYGVFRSGSHVVVIPAKRENLSDQRRTVFGPSHHLSVDKPVRNLALPGTNCCPVIRVVVDDEIKREKCKTTPSGPTVRTWTVYRGKTAPRPRRPVPQDHRRLIVVASSIAHMKVLPVSSSRHSPAKVSIDYRPFCRKGRSRTRNASLRHLSRPFANPYGRYTPLNVDKRGLSNAPSLVPLCRQKKMLGSSSGTK
jgi:hypothetical protein